MINFNLFNKQMTEVSRDLWVMNMNKNKHNYIQNYIYIDIPLYIQRATRSRAKILVEIGYTQTHHINVVPVPYKTVLVLTHFILIYNALISPCHRGQVNGRLDTRFEWDFIFLCEFT